MPTVESFERQIEGMSATMNPIEAARAGHPYSRSDLGLAERVQSYFGEDVVFNADKGLWYIWDGRFWRPDANKIELKKRFAQVARRVFSELSVLPETLSAQRSDYFKFAMSCESAMRIDHAMSLLPTCDGISHYDREFDRNHDVLNVGNGTLNLRTGELLPHTRDALCTKISDTEYRPGAVDPMFSAFIGTTSGGDEDFKAYLQRAAGYSLTGRTGEKCLFLVYSEKTDTAKSTFLNALKTAVGSYSITVEADLLLDRDRFQSTYDLAKLQGARIVSASESKEGRKWNSGLVKNLTGGDPIRAREIRQSSIEFLPDFKLWLATNHAPDVAGGGDAAMWNRMRRVPFNHQIPKKDRDPRIKAALEDPASKTAQAFLRWAVAGAQAWYKQGLGSCALIEAELEEYQRETDPIGAFLDECCMLNSFSQVAKSTFRQAYDEWCRAQGQRYPLSRRGFAAVLKKHGIEPYKGTGGLRVWRGVELCS